MLKLLQIMFSFFHQSSYNFVNFQEQTFSLFDFSICSLLLFNFCLHIYFLSSTYSLYLICSFSSRFFFFFFGSLHHWIEKKKKVPLLLLEMLELLFILDILKIFLKKRKKYLNTMIKKSQNSIALYYELIDTLFKYSLG